MQQENSKETHNNVNFVIPQRNLDKMIKHYCYE